MIKIIEKIEMITCEYCKKQVIKTKGFKLIVTDYLNFDFCCDVHVIYFIFRVHTLNGIRKFRRLFKK